MTNDRARKLRTFLLHTSEDELLERLLSQRLLED